MAILDFLGESAFFGISNWILLAIIGVVFYWIWSRKPKESKYKSIVLEKEVKKDFEKMIEYYSTDLSLKSNTILKIGFNNIGIIRKASKINFPYEKTLIEELKKKQPKSEGEVIKELVTGKKEKKQKKETTTINQEFYLFRTNKASLVGKAMSLVGMNTKMTLVETGMVDVVGSDYVINPNSQFSEYLGIYVFSKSAKEYVTDIAYKLGKEQELEKFVNFVPLLTYLETNQAKISQRYRELTKLEREKYASKVDNLVGSES